MSEELTEAIEKNKHKPNFIAKATLGLAIVGVSLLVILTTISFSAIGSNRDLSEVLARRSPAIEYIACYNQKKIKHDLALSNIVIIKLTDPTITVEDQPLKQALEDLREADKDYATAGDTSVKGSCPVAPLPE